MNDNFGEGALWISAFVFSTVCHEAAHAWTAMKLGDDTAYQGGQVSFNPLPHIRREPIGMIVVPLLSWLMGGYVMGWASAPYDREWAFKFPKRLALMSLAGPGANLALGLIALLGLRLGIEWGFFHSTSWISATQLVTASTPLGSIMAKALSVFFCLNLFLCGFNLLPLPPLDGSTLPMLFLPRSMAEGYLTFLSSPLLRFGGMYLVMRGISFSMAPIYESGANFLFGHF